MSAAKSGPLSGIKILDLTSVVMGPFATQILSSLGADVVKVEAPVGDNMRDVGPMRNEKMGHIFLQANRGKKSISLDLKNAEALEVIFKLAEKSDVFISNIRPAALARLGLDFTALHARNPRLIQVSCCGFSQTGPYASKPAYDDLIQGASCIPWLMEQYGSEQPCYAPVTLADRVTGLHAVYAVTAALYAREKSGIGQEIVVPMFEAMAQFVMGDHMAGLTFDPPIGEPGYARLLTSHRKPYRTLDGHLCVLIYNDKHWKKFFDAIGEPERFEDEKFSSHSNRAANIDKVYSYVAEVMRAHSTDYWQTLLTKADIPNMPMNSPYDLLADEHFRATGFVRRTEHPTEGTLTTVGNPTIWSGTPCMDDGHAPRLGEHSVDVLRDAGFTPNAIEALLLNGALVQAP